MIIIIIENEFSVCTVTLEPEVLDGRILSKNSFQGILFLCHVKSITCKTHALEDLCPKPQTLKPLTPQPPALSLRVDSDGKDLEGGALLGFAAPCLDS